MPQPPIYTPEPGWSFGKTVGLLTALVGVVGLLIALVIASGPGARPGPAPRPDPGPNNTGLSHVSNSAAPAGKAGASRTAPAGETKPATATTTTAPAAKTETRTAATQAADDAAHDAPDGAPETSDEEFFSPVGNWRVYDPQNPAIYFVLRLASNHRMRFEARALGQAGVVTGQGEWSYDPDVPALNVSGRNSADQPFYYSIRFLERQGDKYVVHDANAGGGIMMRIP